MCFIDERSEGLLRSQKVYYYGMNIGMLAWEGLLTYAQRKRHAAENVNYSFCCVVYSSAKKSKQ